MIYVMLSGALKSQHMQWLIMESTNDCLFIRMPLLNVIGTVWWTIRRAVGGCSWKCIPVYTARNWKEIW